MGIRDRIDDIVYGSGRFEQNHPAIANSIYLATLGAIGIAAEAQAIRLDDRPTTIPNAIARASCRAVALGTAYVAGRVIESELN